MFPPMHVNDLMYKWVVEYLADVLALLTRLPQRHTRLAQKAHNAVRTLGAEIDASEEEGTPRGPQPGCTFKTKPGPRPKAKPPG